MEQALAIFEQYGLIAVFIAVFLEQVGAPLPALPVLLLAGALAAADPMFGVSALAVAILASTLGDYAWYWGGRRYGHRVLKLLCRVSLSPDTCVRRSELSFQRWGVASLVLAKFVPGISTVAPPIAGALGIRPLTFLLFNGAGSALWAGAGIAAGVLFNDQIDWMLAQLADLGGHAMVLLGVLLGLYIGYRAWDRWRFVKALRMARISVDELYEMMRREQNPVILDVRSRAHREVDGRIIPGARPVDLDDLERTVADIPPGHDVIVYCACPNEATAVKVARMLVERGFPRVRPLAGGLDAWAAAGFALETIGGDNLGKAA